MHAICRGVNKSTRLLQQFLMLLVPACVCKSFRHDFLCKSHEPIPKLQHLIVYGLRKRLLLQMLRQHAGTLDDARQQHLALAAELAAIQKEMTQLQITQWQPILAAFDQQLEVCHQQPESNSAHLKSFFFILIGLFFLFGLLVEFCNACCCRVVMTFAGCLPDMCCTHTSAFHWSSYPSPFLNTVVLPDT